MLGPRQRARLLERLGPVVRVVADDERSQSRNRALARERLAARLAAALRVERPRRPTAPSRGSVERRLEAQAAPGRSASAAAAGAPTRTEWRPDRTGASASGGRCRGRLDPGDVAAAVHATFEMAFWQMTRTASA